MHCHEVFATELRCSPGHIILEGLVATRLVPRKEWPAVPTRKSGERCPGVSG